MRTLKNLAAAAAIASLAVTPVMAQASAGSKLSLRGVTKAKNSSQMASSLVGPAIVVAGLVIGIVVISSSSSGATSP